MSIFLFFVTVLTRLPFASKLLYHMDSGHFALALENYNLTLHQPHPPGYFLYIMLGRFVRLFVNDANTAMVTVSVVFSGLAVITVFHLGREIFNEKTGLLAALLMLTSPNFWFHGEVALSYPADAFFSSLVGLFCWRALHGNVRYAWMAALALGISSGFRQNTGVFLLPLWLFSIRKESLRSIATGVAIFGIACFSWFIPMVIMTGGPESYLSAFTELWQFNTGHNSVFEKGISSFIHNLLYINAFTFYALYGSLPFLLFTSYVLFRTTGTSIMKDPRAGFFLYWILPTVLFYLLIFISWNPGYILIIMPPLVILSAAAVKFLATKVLNTKGNILYHSISTLLIAINLAVFIFAESPVSYNEIKTHDSEIKTLVSILKNLDHKTTAIFAEPDYYHSFRNIMVYLPQFIVYQVDVRVSKAYGIRKLFGGQGGNTFLVDTLKVPQEISHFAAIIRRTPNRQPALPQNMSVVAVSPTIVIVQGPINRILELFPDLNCQLKL